MGVFLPFGLCGLNSQLKSEPKPCLLFFFLCFDRLERLRGIYVISFSPALWCGLNLGMPCLLSNFDHSLAPSLPLFLPSSPSVLDFVIQGSDLVTEAEFHPKCVLCYKSDRLLSPLPPFLLKTVFACGQPIKAYPREEILRPVAIVVFC